MAVSSVNNQKNLLKLNFPALFLLLCHVCINVSPGYSQTSSQQFSLDGGNLSGAPADAKAPEPGAVTAKYGFMISKDFMPYMGTGLAYAYQPHVWSGDVTNFKTGLAAQFGFSYLLGGNSTLKLDYKYLTVAPEQQRNESRTPPQSLGIGLNIKF
jgi:opacity protein-like surface antigen